MMSFITTCSTCGESQKWTLTSYCTAWLRGLLTKCQKTTDKEMDMKLTTYDLLGEKLLAPPWTAGWTAIP